MTMNLYLHEIKSSFKALLIWIVALGGTVIFMMSIYPTFADQEDQFDQLMKGFPPEILRAFGLSDFNFGNLLQFFGYILSFILLAVAIFAINSGANILSKEEIDRTAEFLLTRPITRRQVVTYKSLAAITNISLLNITFFCISLIGLETVKKSNYDYQTVFVFFVAVYLFQLLFMAIGLTISVVMKRAKSVPSITLGIVFGFYGLSLIAGVFNEKPWVSYLTPFRYFDTFKIAKEGTLEANFVSLSFILIVLSTVITYYKYSKRDITA